MPGGHLEVLDRSEQSDPAWQRALISDDCSGFPFLFGGEIKIQQRNSNANRSAQQGSASLRSHPEDAAPSRLGSSGERTCRRELDSADCRNSRNEDDDARGGQPIARVMRAAWDHWQKWCRRHGRAWEVVKGGDERERNRDGYSGSCKEARSVVRSERRTYQFLLAERSFRIDERRPADGMTDS